MCTGIPLSILFFHSIFSFFPPRVVAMFYLHLVNPTMPDPKPYSVVCSISIRDSEFFAKLHQLLWSCRGTVGSQNHTCPRLPHRNKREMMHIKNLKDKLDLLCEIHHLKCFETSNYFCDNNASIWCFLDMNGVGL